ncbi:MAG: conjugative relaxase [Emcibacter sp.]|nr:conjugative relaxase [Emcibacter sp.]
MLSMAAIPSAQNASEYYFKAENYYTAEKSAVQKAEWYGKGGIALGLEGQVIQPVFGAILRGQLPNGVKLGRVVGSDWKHFPGVDMTFSAPKSLSLLAYIGGDSRLLDANRDAVKTTLNWVEKNMIMTRIKEKGETSHVKTGSLVAALFPHDMSRTNDPQAHIHPL